MPLRPVSLRPEDLEFADQQQPEQQTQEQEPGLTAKDVLKKAGQFATGLGVSAVRGAELPRRGLELLYNVAGTPEEHRGKFFDKYPSEYLEEAVGKENIEPENMFSRALQYTVGNWPLLFLGGAPTAAKVGADIAGSLGITAAEELGLGPFFQLGASVLTSHGFNKASNLLKKIPKEPGKIAQFTSDLYKKEAELGSKIPVNSNELFKKLSDVEKEVNKEFVSSRSFPAAKKQEILENIKTAYEKIDKTNLNAADVFDIKKSINKIYMPPTTTAGKMYHKVRGIFVDELDHLAEKNKAWGNTFKQADELHSIANWQTSLGRMLTVDPEKIAEKAAGATVQAALTVLTGANYGLKGAALSTLPLVGVGALKAGEAVARGSKFLNALRKTPEGSKLLWDIAANSAKENSSALSKNISKLNKMAKKYDEENPEEEKDGINPVQMNPEDFEFAD